MNRITSLASSGLAAGLLLVGGVAQAGVKTHWTIEVHDTYTNPNSGTLIYSRPEVISFPGDSIPVYLEGSTYLPLFPKGMNSGSATGNFAFAPIEADLSGGRYRFGMWDRTGGTGDNFHATFETESRIRAGEAQRVFFTHGDVLSGKSRQYLVLIRLDRVEACDDASSCLKK